MEIQFKTRDYELMLAGSREHWETRPHNGITAMLMYIASERFIHPVI